MRESVIEQKHRKIAQAHGWMVVKIMQASPNGFPDRFYARAHRQDVCRTCNRGRIVLFEWKTVDGVLSRQQELRIDQLRSAGVEVHVVRSIEQANRILGIDDDAL